MASCTCVDGPLKGHSFTWRRPPSSSGATTVALLDVEHGVLEVTYRLDRRTGAGTSGVLTFVGAREEGRWRRRGRRTVPLLH